MRLFRRGNGRFLLFPAVLLLMIFTAGVSWFFGYQNRMLIPGLGSGTVSGKGDPKAETGAEEQTVEASEENLIPLLSEPIVTESQISEYRTGAVQTGEAQNVTDPEETKVPTIRVLLHTSDYKSLLHDEIVITSPEAFFLSWEGGEELFAANSTVTIRPDDLRLQGGKIIFHGKGGFTLSNVHRECGYPEYPGKIEIRPDGKKLALINEVDLEQYLQLVVPGEMLSSYGVEALKVQAVCARSYAWCQMQTLAYEKYGAHVDDSVNYQVYNNQLASADSDRAVKDTGGQVLEYGEQIVETYYFSTSCGHTTDMEIWQSDPEDYPYFPAAAVAEGREVLNLADENTFRSFIDWYRNSFDEGFSFYRWEIALGMDALEASVEHYLEEHGMDQVGEIIDLEITSRGSGGIIRELTITGTKGKAVLERQGSVREALGNDEMIISLSDGSEVTGWNTIPSAFFYLEEQAEDGQTEGYILHGGGYGHGVGMSQNGVYRMVQEGYTYDQILSYFYPGTNLIKVFL